MHRRCAGRPARSRSPPPPLAWSSPGAASSSGSGSAAAGTTPAGTTSAATTSGAATPAHRFQRVRHQLRPRSPRSSCPRAPCRSRPRSATPGSTATPTAARRRTRSPPSTQVAAGQQIDDGHHVQDNGTTTHSTYDYIVQPNGQISLPTSQFAPSTAGVSIKVVSGGIFWPSAAQLASGQPVHTTLTMQITIAGKTQKITEHITSQGAGHPVGHGPGRHLQRLRRERRGSRDHRRLQHDHR